MATLTPFVPTLNENFAFQPTLDGQQYSCVVTWSLSGQRWIVNLYTLTGALTMARPLRGSPLDYDINLVAGYFTSSTLVFRVSTNCFEVTP